jgi:membrane protein implicated in regulation of membrane protease activity
MSTFLVYLFCLVVGFVFLLGSAVFGHLFGDHGHVEGSGGHAEAGADSSDAPGISILSPIVMAAFVTAFGAFGLVFTQFEITKPPLISAPLSFLAGAAVALALVSVLRKVMRAADSSSESRIATLIGHDATVITPIPASGVGEIAYVQAGTRYTAPAREEHGVPVASGYAVTITRIVGSQFYVTVSAGNSSNQANTPNRL